MLVNVSYLLLSYLKALRLKSAEPTHVCFLNTKLHFSTPKEEPGLGMSEETASWRRFIISTLSQMLLGLLNQGGIYGLNVQHAQATWIKINYLADPGFGLRITLRWFRVMWGHDDSLDEGFSVCTHQRASLVHTVLGWATPTFALGPYPQSRNTYCVSKGATLGVDRVHASLIIFVFCLMSGQGRGREGLLNTGRASLKRGSESFVISW